MHGRPGPPTGAEDAQRPREPARHFRHLSGKTLGVSVTCWLGCEPGQGRGHRGARRPRGALRLRWLVQGPRFVHAARGASRPHPFAARPPFQTPPDPSPACTGPPGADSRRKHAPHRDRVLAVHVPEMITSGAVGGRGLTRHRCEVHLTGASAGHAAAGGFVPPEGRAAPRRLCHTPREATQLLGTFPTPQSPEACVLHPHLFLDPRGAPRLSSDAPASRHQARARGRTHTWPAAPSWR